MLLPPDTPQSIADALGYLQYHLQELMERQYASKNNINTTLAALAVQLQQLTQLVANPVMIDLIVSRCFTHGLLLFHITSYI